MNKKKGKEPPDPRITEYFANKLKSLIKTNDSLAAKIGVSAQTVADYVNKKSLPRADILLKISRALKIPMENLLTDEENYNDGVIDIRKIEEIEYYNYLREIFSSDDIETQLAVKQNLKQFAKLIKKTPNPEDTFKKCVDPSSTSGGIGRKSIKKTA